jgi:hypothetical protein
MKEGKLYDDKSLINEYLQSLKDNIEEGPSINEANKRFNENSMREMEFTQKLEENDQSEGQLINTETIDLCSLENSKEILNEFSKEEMREKGLIKFSKIYELFFFFFNSHLTSSNAIFQKFL